MVDTARLILDLLNSKHHDSCVHKFQEDEINYVIETLNTSVEKTPVRLTYKPLIDSGWAYECPTCGCAVGQNKNALDYTQEDKYCPSCGQKLDWRTKNDK